MSPRPVRATLRRTAAVVSVLALALTMGACSKEPEPVATPTVTVDASIDGDKSGIPDPEVPDTWALTGVRSDKIKNRPAVSVKIENTSAARPQEGLENADVVWESVVEFGVSRFIAVYHSDMPKEIGPVRSARPVDLRVISSLDGLFVFSGAQKGVLNLINSSKHMQAISHDAGAAGLYRTSARRAPHNVYGSLDTFVDQAKGKFKDSPQEQFSFAREADQAAAVLEGAKTTNIAMRMSDAVRPQWDWNAKSSTWQRSEGSNPAMAASGARLSATNVVIIEVESFNSPFKAQGEAPVPDNKLEGKGKAVVATGGKTLDVTWKKKNAAAPLKLFTKDGEAADLAPGNTWVELVPKPAGSYSLN